MSFQVQGKNKFYYGEKPSQRPCKGYPAPQPPRDEEAEAKGRAGQPLHSSLGARPGKYLEW